MASDFGVVRTQKWRCGGSVPTVEGDKGCVPTRTLQDFIAASGLGVAS